MTKDRTSRWLFGLVLLLILLAAGWVRLFNLDWDKGTHLHPDERYLTMVASGLRFPDQLGAYWDTAQSPLNPANQNQPGYVYGTLPLFMTRAAGEWIDRACGDAPAPLASLAHSVLFGNQGSCRPETYTGYSGIHLVGRYLSTIADLLSLVGLVLIARELYDDRIALLSGALYAFAALPIQHAHFFVVDSFATVFVIWTLVLAVSAIIQRRPWLLCIAGLTTGLAVASKISVWPLAGIVALASIITIADDEDPDKNITFRFGLSTSQVVAAIVSGMLAAFAFRTAQPYAFAGPGFFGVRINPTWMELMRGAQELASGLRDVPFGHQWTSRTPIIFPWRNMVFWGLGLPLGITAWVGWAVMGWQIIRHKSWRHLLPWVWGTAFFLYQGTQWVKSMRYLLPIYPVFVLFAAWLLFRWYPKAKQLQKAKHWLQKGYLLIRLAMPPLILIGAALWAFAFLQIYARPVTRVEASRWIYQNIPTAATLKTSQGVNIQAPIKPNTVLGELAAPITAPVTPDQQVTVDRVDLNKVSGFQEAGVRNLRVFISEDPTGTAILSEGEITTDLPPEDVVAVSVPVSPVELAAGQTAYLIVQLLEGPAIELKTSVIANEHWDDPVPLRIDGKDPFWTWYQGLSSSPSTLMNLYDNDIYEKRWQLLRWLDEADYIALSSNRLYGSIPRLPTRYPLTIAYYEALFDGSLGFELLAEFVSFPAIGPCQFPDQEVPFEKSAPRYSNARPCSIAYPPAEEAYSVYDHPQVLIFAKTDAYSRSKAEALLPETLLRDVKWMTPKEMTLQRRQKSLMMTPRMRLTQEAGGTWSEIFNRNALQNRAHIVTVVLWWVMLTVVGWCAFPWIYNAFPALRYRGYALSRAIGLLLWAYPLWLLASLRLVPNTRLAIWVLFFVLFLASAYMAHRQRETLQTFVQDNGKALLRLEILFTVLYLVWVYIRYLNPDLWHPVVGGEKPMDFAYLNAVIKSTWFPPYDPWFAGGIMNYYYFGFVLFSVPVKALGIVPSIAYNLIVPSLFAMTGVGAYTLASNLADGDARRGRRAGFWGIALVLLLGNLGEVRLLFKGFEEIGNIDFESLIPGYPALVSALAGLWKFIVKGDSLNFRPEWWYWDARSVIPFDPGEAGPINEFPLFTFLFGDLHAHMLALPFTQIALTLALQWALQRRPKAYILNNTANSPSSGQALPWVRIIWDRLSAWAPQPFATFVLAALVMGTLRATNTWDYPTYLALIAVGVSIGAFRIFRESRASDLLDDDATSSNRSLSSFPYYYLLIPVLVFLLAELLFLPYTRNYAVAYDTFKLWEGSRTPLGIYFIMHGHFLFPLILLAICEGYLVLKKLLDKRDSVTTLWLITAAVGMVVVLIALRLIGVHVAWVAVPLGFVAALLLLYPQNGARSQLLWFWIGTALAISLVVEIIVVEGDVGRMNTVFKFYLQVWMLFALAAAIAVERMLGHILHREPAATPSQTETNAFTPSRLFGDWALVILACLLFGAALYTALAIPARARDRWNPNAPRSLDGMIYMPYTVQYEHGGTIPLAVDYQMIRWLQDNVEGSPTIIEGQGEREYLWGNRISVYTGLPSVAAWRWHQVQQRMVMAPGTVEQRQFDIRAFYSTPDPDHALRTLEKYDVQYVILGPYERAYMLPEGESKFTTLVDRGDLNVVYQNQYATIYAVVH